MKIIEDNIIEMYKNSFPEILYPNIVKTKNITKEGLDLLINKNKLYWSYSKYYDNVFDYMDGVITWGNNNKVMINFKKIENSLCYGIIILTDDLENISLLLMGLNKFYTIDKIWN